MAEAVLRVLVVEDHIGLGRFIGAALDVAGWVAIGPVTEHAAAIDAAQRLPCDLVLLDRMLQGEETLAIAVAASERGLPCLLMSGYPRSTLPGRLRALPFLEKPFTMDALIAAVRAAAGVA